MSIAPREAMALRGIGIPEGFRARGTEVSRIEGFSDAAFAFAMTLLVISLEVPTSFDRLLEIMRGLPAFAACFAVLVVLWADHYKFFRRYGLEDALTVALNSVLLFVIMFYVYPMKFVYTLFLGAITGIQPGSAGQIEIHQIRGVVLVFGIGFIAVFVLMALMNLRAWHLRQALELNEVERLVTREEITRCFGHTIVGGLSILAAWLLPERWAGMAGLVYVAMGVNEALVGTYFGSARAKALQRAQRTLAGGAEKPPQSQP